MCLEIIAVFFLWGKARDKLEARGYVKTFWLQLLLPVFVFGGQISAIVLYSILQAVVGIESGLGFAYGAALIGAAFGAIAYFVGIRLLPRRKLLGEEYLQPGSFRR